MGQSVRQVLNSYPEKVEKKMVELRKIILDVAETDCGTIPEIGVMLSKS